MFTDSSIWAFSGSENRDGNHNSVLACSDRTVVNESQFKDTSMVYDILGFPLTSNDPRPRIISKDYSEILEADSGRENNYRDAVLRYIDQVLMEDDLDNKACKIEDSTLRATEKSLYEILNDKKHSFSPNQHPPQEDTSSSSDDSVTLGCCNFSNNHVDAYSSAESGIITDLQKFKSSHVQNPHFHQSFQSNLLSLFPPEAKEKDLKVEANVGKDEWELRGRRSIIREENDLEVRRSNKHIMTYDDESVLNEMFEKVLSLYGGNNESEIISGDGPASRESQKKGERTKASNRGVNYMKKGPTKREAIDMRGLLIQCMQSVAGNDHEGAKELLKRIKLRSSPSGDGSQRLAHYFANGLEARLVGAGSPEYKALYGRKIPELDVLKAYMLYITEFPFIAASHFFANEMIMELAEKATSVHVIHFGIVSGLQWPSLIQRLSTRPGGPPRLRITGIDVPQAGFRPDARVKETGCRLANYCEKFNVPFRYNGIAKNWELVTVGDLRIEEDEVLVVNCLYHFKKVLDDTILEHSPRDAVLNLIKRINPDIFIHGIVSGTFNSPFFISRFREALFYYSTLFDMLDANVPRANMDRMVFEREVLGSEISNIIACEGLERLERPETYKQWRVRTSRAGFRQLPLSQEIMKKVKAKIKARYHKDFYVDEASQWMLLGWKGRVIFALACWKPA